MIEAREAECGYDAKVDYAAHETFTAPVCGTNKPSYHRTKYLALTTFSAGGKQVRGCNFGTGEGLWPHPRKQSHMPVSE
jgi:hypothetical protein